MAIGKTAVAIQDDERAPFRFVIVDVCSKVAEWGLLSLLVLVPLMFIPSGTMDVFDVSKVTAYRLVMVVILAALAIRAVLNGGFTLRRTRLDFPILIFFGVAIVALFHTLSFTVSLLGEYGREDGFITLVSNLVVFYLAVNLLSTRQLIKRALVIQALVGLVVSLMAILENFSITPFAFSPEYAFDNRVMASLGNPDFLGSYLVMVIPLAVGLLLDSLERKERLLWTGVTVFASVALVLTYTRGAWIAAVASVLVFLLSWRQIWKLKFWAIGVVVALVAMVLVLELPWVNAIQADLRSARQATAQTLHGAIFSSTTTHGATTQNAAPQSSDRTAVGEPAIAERAFSIFNTQSGTIQVRLQIWKGALPLVAANPIIGTGLNSFQSAFPKYIDSEYAAGEGMTRFPDRAHNDYLQIAATMGLLGLGAYLAVLAAFGSRLGGWFRKHRGYRRWTLLVAILAAWAAYLVNNFFLFSEITTGLQFWFLMGLGVALCSAGPEAKKEGTGEQNRELSIRFPSTKWLLYAAPIPIVALSALLLFLSIKPLVADYLFYQASVEPSVQWRSGIEKAISWNTLNSKLPELYAGMLAQEAESSQNPRQKQELLDEAVRQLTASIQMEPYSAGLYYLRGAVYSEYAGDHVADAYSDFKKAVELYPNFYYANQGLANTAHALNLPSEAVGAELALLAVSPGDQQALYGLVSDYVALGRNGEAEALLKKVLERNPRDANMHLHLGRFYEMEKDTAKASSEYRLAISLDANLQEAKDALSNLENSGSGT